MNVNNECRFEKQRDYLIKILKGRITLFNELKSKGVNLFDEEIKIDTKRYMTLRESQKISKVA
jgi:hypothetical protein